MPRATSDGDSWRAIDDGDIYSFHRDKCGEVAARGMALVARPVRTKEVKTNPAAQASFDFEYSALCHDLKAWDMAVVKEWYDAQA